MQTILTNRTTTITELKKSPSKVLANAVDEPIAILTHNKIRGYIFSPETVKEIMEKLEDAQLSMLVKKRLKANYKRVKVKLDEL